MISPTISIDNTHTPGYTNDDVSLLPWQHVNQLTVNLSNVHCTLYVVNVDYV